MNSNRFRRTNNRREGLKDEYAIVLDVVEDNSKSYNNDEIAQAIGVTTYSLLELVPKEGIILKNSQKVYIGDDKREEIQYIKRTIPANQLSGTSKSELLFTLTDIIKEREDEFVKFFNIAGPITIRKHAFELISRIGKKHLADLIEERNKSPFKSFKDIENRCPYLQEVSKAIAQRILIEIEGEDDFKFFTRK